jgi:Flp pilus assembly CpaE family ATPase
VRSASRIATRLRTRYGAQRVTAIVNRADGASPIAHGDVERAIGFEVAHMIPSDYRVALHALNNGRPLALDNHNELSGALKRVAYRLAGVQPERKPSKSSGLLGLLTQARRS